MWCQNTYTNSLQCHHVWIWQSHTVYTVATGVSRTCITQYSYMIYLLCAQHCSLDMAYSFIYSSCMYIYITIYIHMYINCLQISWQRAQVYRYEPITARILSSQPIEMQHVLSYLEITGQTPLVKSMIKIRKILAVQKHAHAPLKVFLRPHRAIRSN